MVYYLDGHHSITTSNHNDGNTASASMRNKFISGMVDSLSAHHDPTDPNWQNLSLNLSPYTIPLVLANLGCYHQAECVKLDVVGNDAGFQTRLDHGTLTEGYLLNQLRSLPRSAKTRVVYHIDVVARSMGFAYARGLISALRNFSSIRGAIQWGGYYLIAPEDGCADSVDPNSFEEVWQYGSNLGQVNADSV